MSDFEQNYEFKQFQIRIQKVYFHLLHVIAVHSNRELFYKFVNDSSIGSSECHSLMKTIGYLYNDYEIRMVMQLIDGFYNNPNDFEKYYGDLRYLYVRNKDKDNKKYKMLSVFRLLHDVFYSDWIPYCPANPQEFFVPDDVVTIIIHLLKIRNKLIAHVEDAEHTKERISFKDLEHVIVYLLKTVKRLGNIYHVSLPYCRSTYNDFSDIGYLFYLLGEGRLQVYETYKGKCCMCGHNVDKSSFIITFNDECDVSFYKSEFVLKPTGILCQDCAKQQGSWRSAYLADSFWELLDVFL